MIESLGKVLQDRAHAARLLAMKIAKFKNSNAIVVGIGQEGASVGAMIAKELNLSFEIVLCRQVLHPANSDRVIGSVSEGVVMLRDDVQDIPKDSLVRQIAKLQMEIEKDKEFIYGTFTRPTFKYQTVIPVGDILSSSNNLLAGLKVIQSQSPLQVIVAVPVIDPHVASEVAAEVNDLVFIQMGVGLQNEKYLYKNHLPVDLSDIKKSVSSIKNHVLNLPAIPLESHS